MGAESVMAGLQPGVVSALIEAGAEVDGLRAAVNLDAAFELMQPKTETESEANPDVEPDASLQSESGQVPGNEP